MDIFNFNPDTLLSFYLTMFRISIILFMMPFFGGDSLPKTVKAAMLIVLTLAVFPSLSFPGSMMPANVVEIAVMFLGEVIMGLILSMLVNFFFSSIQFGGHILGFNMGFAMVSVIDPITGVSEAVTAHFLYMCTMLTFLTLGGQYYIISALAQSFKFVPPGGLLITGAAYDQIMMFSVKMFSWAVMIAAPIILAMFITDLSLALIGRAAPQMNILMVGFPVKIMVGFLFLGMVFTLVANEAKTFLSGMEAMFGHMLRALGPG